MSIYPVKFEKFWMKEVRVTGLDKYIGKSGRCAHCKGRMPSYGFIAYHALGYGYAWGDWWCSWSCCNGERKINRHHG